jgi:hypothetical protein
MTSSEDRLRNLAEKVGSLLVEPTSAEEIDRLFTGADERLRDAKVGKLSASGRFTLAYEASHGFALAALRSHGYRPSQMKGHRKVVFDVLDSTARAPTSLASALARYHDRRNRITYDGMFIATQAEAEDLVNQVSALRDLVAEALQKRQSDK